MNITTELADYSNPEHAQDIIHLLNLYAMDPMGGGSPLPRETQERLIPALAERLGAFSLIAYALTDTTNDCNQPGKKAIGLANCFEGFSTFKCKPLVNIHDLAVLEPYRGKGIAQLLLDKVCEIAKEKNCCKVTLEVLEGNKPAQQAYIKSGFKGYELDPAMGSALFWEKAL